MPIAEAGLGVLAVGVDAVEPILGVAPPAPADGAEEAEEAVVEDLRRRHQAEAHAQPQQAARVGDVGRLRDLLILHEPLGIRVLQKDVLAFARSKIGFREFSFIFSFNLGL